MCERRAIDRAYLCECPCSGGDGSGANTASSTNVHDTHPASKSRREIIIVERDGVCGGGSGWQVESVGKVGSIAACSLGVSAWSVEGGLHSLNMLSHRFKSRRRCVVVLNDKPSFPGHLPVTIANATGKSVLSEQEQYDKRERLSDTFCVPPTSASATEITAGQGRRAK